MADLPPLPELRFAEIPATSRHRYAGDRFCYMEAGGPTSRRSCCCMASAATRCTGAISGRPRRSAGRPRRSLPADRVECPGYLLSDNLLAETPSCRDYADTLDDLLAALGISGFDIVANSFGTRVAHCFAYHRPGRIGRAVFTGTSIPHGTPPEERARTVEMRARMIERGGYGFGDRATALLGSAASADTLALVQQTVRATNPAGFMQAARFIAKAEMPPLSAGLTMPLLMIQGEEDRVAPSATNAELLAATLPRARLVMLAGCGHLPEVEFPLRVNDLIATHLS
jgi:pimeloyl-ACP methyl ester carboxylesterase